MLNLATLERVTFKEQADWEDEHEDSSNSKVKKGARRSSIGRLFNKMFGSRAEQSEISTRFSFELKTTDKTYTMFTSTKEEALEWEKIINIIISMNKKGLSVDKINPFDYQKWQNLKKEPQNPLFKPQEKTSRITKESYPAENVSE